MKTTIFISVIIFSLLSGCSKDGTSPFGEPKTKGFNSPEEFLENPSVKNAIEDSGIQINEGENPPVLSGIYLLDGYVTKVSPVIQDLYGSIISSTVTLYNQTTSGKISFKEEIQGIVVQGTGGYIIGDDGKFSIFQESIQKGEEAGLPSDLSVTVVLIMSGQKHEDGNLTAKGISIITDASSSNSGNYDLETLKKVWWMWECLFVLQGPAKKSLPLEALIPFPSVSNVLGEDLENFKIK